MLDSAKKGQKKLRNGQFLITAVAPVNALPFRTLQFVGALPLDLFWEMKLYCSRLTTDIHGAKELRILLSQNFGSRPAMLEAHVFGHLVTICRYVCCTRLCGHIYGELVPP